MTDVSSATSLGTTHTGFLPSNCSLACGQQCFLNRHVVQGKPSLGSRIFSGFITARAGLFNLALLGEIKALAGTFFTDEFRAVFAVREIRRRGVDDLLKTRYYFFVKFGVEGMCDFSSLPFVVFDGRFRSVLKPPSRWGENSRLDLFYFL